jgi:hypothetical protein
MAGDFTYVEGFEDEATAVHFPVSAADAAYSEVAGEWGGFALRRDDNNGPDNWSLTVSGRAVVIGFRLGITGTNNITMTCHFGKGSSRETGFQITSSGQISPSSFSAAAGSGSAQLPVGGYAYIEMVIEVDSGSTNLFDIDVYVDGASVISGTGLNFTDTGNIQRIDFEFDAFAKDGLLTIDDLYVWQSATGTDRPPTVNGRAFPYQQIYIPRLLPDADGALTDWSGGSGAAAAMDDDDPSTSTATSISSTTSTDQESVSVGTIPVSVDAVLAVVYDVWGQGTAATLDPLWRSSGGSVGTDTTNTIPLASTWDGARSIVPTNPQTATDWTAADITSGEFGFELE